MNTVKRIPALDGVRAIAVVAVLLAHFPAIEGVPFSALLNRLVHALRLSTLGVDLFFVLSGFLITRILINEKRETGHIQLGSFYIKRTIRIVPIYILCLLVSAAFFGFSQSEILSLSTYTFNLYHPFYPAPHAMEHTWSLSVEEQFYLAWPFLISAIPMRSGRLITAILVPALAVLAGSLFALNFSGPLADDLIYMSSATRMLSLSLGGYLAFSESEGFSFSGARCLQLLGAGTAILVTAILARAAGVIPPEGLYWVLAIVGFGLVSTAVLALVALGSGPAPAVIRRGLDYPPLRYVGKISYGLYLYHYPVLFALKMNEAAVGDHGVSIARWGCGLGMTVALAVASFHLIEVQFLKLKARFESARRKLSKPVMAMH
ncbi:acyltransferase family protein [Rhizobium oryzicola]|uniref:Acyltransferase n=1 Tax=Rhizobium oryzicola TaxID=1232668 RepID=A0ABT8STX5_9HYPH|nr:acyltransferase [Rhizobium oryzicola]MDO1581880.1 acyltransferase [Rhizobium oryzicola]